MSQNFETGGLRASDSDRDQVLSALAGAYAEGRLDRTEYDERSGAAATARYGGELSALLADLPSGAPVRTGEHPAALARWQKQRNDALACFLTTTVICWTVWAVVMLGGFPWPVFPMLGTALGVVGVHLRRTEILARHERSLPAAAGAGRPGVGGAQTVAHR